MIKKQSTGLSLQVPSSKKLPSSQRAFNQVSGESETHTRQESDQGSVKERNYSTEAGSVTGGERAATGRQYSIMAVQTLAAGHHRIRSKASYLGDVFTSLSLHSSAANGGQFYYDTEQT